MTDNIMENFLERKRFLLPKTLDDVEKDLSGGRVRLSDSLRGNLIVFQLLGYWFPEKTENGTIYAAFSVLMVSCVLVVWNGTQFIQLYLIRDDLEAVAASLYIVTCTGLEFIKAYYVLAKRREISDIIRSFDREIFRPKRGESYELVAAILRFYQKTFMVFLVTASFACFFLATYPIFDAGGSRKLPFNAWFPWDYVETPGYEITYAYQVFGLFSLSTLNVTFDTSAAGLMSNICAQLDHLVHKLESLNSGFNSNLTQADYEDSFEECVRHHKNILDLNSRIEAVYSVSVFFQFVITCTTLCMTMFQLTLVPTFSFEFFSLIFYQINVEFQIVMYCWFGNEVILKSEKLSSAAFGTGWPDRSGKFKRNLHFFMLRTSKPMKLRAGGFFVLSMETFTLILRSSWSYFAVLRQVHDE